MKPLKKLGALSHVWALLCVVYGWVIFTQDTVGGIAEYTKAMFGGYGFLGAGSNNALILMQRADVNTVFLIALAAAVIFSMPTAGMIKKKLAAFAADGSRRLSAVGYVCDGALIAALLLCTVQLALGAYNPFIYFRF